MIRAGTGIATGSDAVSCAREAARGAMDRLGRAADFVLLFTSGAPPESFEGVLTAVRRACGTDRIAGCTGVGILTETGEREGVSGAAVCAVGSDALEGVPFLLDGLRGRDDAIGRAAGDLVRPGDGDNALLVVFPDTPRCVPDALFAGVLAAAGPIPVVGGGAAGTGGETWQFSGERAATNAVSGMVIRGDLSVSVGVTHSCLPVGRTWTITEAIGNSVRRLDASPALEALLESLGGFTPGGAGDRHRLASHLFVAFPDKESGALARDGYIVRNILGVDPDDGAIFVGHEVAAGDRLCFALRDPDGAREDLKAMLEERAALAGRPGFGLYFNCCARGRSLYGHDGIDTAYIANAFETLPLIGFFGLAEIAPAGGRTRLHNYSGVIAHLSEPRPGAGAVS